MRSKLLAAILIGIAAVGVFETFGANAEKIARAQADAQRLAIERNSLRAAVRERDE
jgi:hypothetical protein